MFKGNSLYLVLTGECCNGRDPLLIAKEAALEGVDIIQMREKNIPKSGLAEYGAKLKLICSENKVIFIVNDDPYLAGSLNADGVHLGQEDLIETPVKIVREILGDKIIGISTHSLEQFEKANNEDFDYIAFGPIFYTKTKDYHIGMKDVEVVLAKATKPVVFIGGINKTNVQELVKKGAKNIAMIRAITESDNIGETIKYFKKKLNIH
ncbi:MAG: thiamine phosphate synthase [Candidatus Omnitrophica bacterium]|nr:thiamine phosphate synthase [Candidatus Omnitrophota bacterium]